MTQRTCLQLRSPVAIAFDRSAFSAYFANFRHGIDHSAQRILNCLTVLVVVAACSARASNWTATVPRHCSFAFTRIVATIRWFKKMYELWNYATTPGLVRDSTTATAAIDVVFFAKPATHRCSSCFWRVGKTHLRAQGRRSKRMQWAEVGLSRDAILFEGLPERVSNRILRSEIKERVLRSQTEAPPAPTLLPCTSSRAAWRARKASAASKPHPPLDARAVSAAWRRE